MTATGLNAEGVVAVLTGSIKPTLGCSADYADRPMFMRWFMPRRKKGRVLYPELWPKDNCHKVMMVLVVPLVQAKPLSLAVRRRNPMCPLLQVPVFPVLRVDGVWAGVPAIGQAAEQVMADAIARVPGPSQGICAVARSAATKLRCLQEFPVTSRCV